MVVLEKITAPASRSRAAGGASIAAGTSLVEFSPSGALQQTMAVIEANLAAAGEGR